MSSFHDVLFPLPLAFGASGGPQRQTEIITLANGHEQRNTSQAGSRRRYDAGVGIKSLKDVQALISFFEARRGQLYGFRFRDPVDFSSADHSVLPTSIDQVIGTGDGAAQVFSLVKHYEDWQRPITKPVGSTVRAAINGVDTSAFTVDENIGLITFDSAPASGVLITAGFEFDVPVRFDTDHLNVSLESFGAGSAVHVPLIEIKTDA